MTTKLYGSLSQVRINNDFAENIKACASTEDEHRAWESLMQEKAKMWDAIASDEENSRDIRISAAARRNAICDLIVLWRRNF